MVSELHVLFTTCNACNFFAMQCIYIGVSKNRGTPKSSILIGFSIINHPFWGTPIFGNTHMFSCVSTPLQYPLLFLPRCTRYCVFWIAYQVVAWQLEKPKDSVWEDWGSP